MFVENNTISMTDKSANIKVYSPLITTVIYAGNTNR